MSGTMTLTTHWPPIGSPGLPWTPGPPRRARRTRVDLLYCARGGPGVQESPGEAPGGRQVECVFFWLVWDRMCFVMVSIRAAVAISCRLLLLLSRLSLCSLLLVPLGGCQRRRLRVFGLSEGSRDMCVATRAISRSAVFVPVALRLCFCWAANIQYI